MTLLANPRKWFLLMLLLLASMAMYGCLTPVGPTKPLLYTIEAQSKFSDRFQLEEEPQFFYDLFGKELLEGNEVWQYREEKTFDQAGKLIIGRTGQLDSERFSSQLDRTILTEDTYRGRHTEFAIGDHIRIKPETLFPAVYIMRKTEFDGLRWDISFSQERHLFSLLNSRISNPLFIPEAAANLAPTKGRRNSDDWLENSRLIGFRGQGMLGDIFRVGFTYINLHKEHPQRLENPFRGTVANTPPDRITITFRDDSPEDDKGGAALKGVEILVTTETKVPRGEKGKGIPEKQLPPIKVTAKDVGPSLLPDGNPDPDSAGGKDFGAWKVANGFDSFQYVFEFEKFKIDRLTVKKVVFNMTVAGDYNILVSGFSPENKGDAEAPWIKTESGQIVMPFRDVIQAPGNFAQEENLDPKDKTWPEKKAKQVAYQYGAARGAELYGVDLEGTLFNVAIRAQYSVNGKYKQYPIVSADTIDYSLRAKNTPDARTFADTDGEAFDAKMGGDDSDKSEKAWFVNLKQRWGKFLFEESFYHADPGYTTTYQGFGANTDRDETFSLPRTPQSPNDQAPFDEDSYQLVEDDDDNDDFPDADDFDGVLPQADDRDLNGILDFQEDFLIFEADPPVFEDLVDLNNNGIIDSLEDDFEPDYEYGIDREGKHLIVAYDVLDNATIKLGWLDDNEISSARRNNTKYAHLTYQRDIPDFGTIIFQNRFLRVRDDIPDYAITLRVGGLEPEQVPDPLDFWNVWNNITTLQFLYTAIPGLTLETKYLLSFRKQLTPEAEEKIRIDDPRTKDVDETIDFMVPKEQVRESGEKREYPFYPDPVLIFDPKNWTPRQYRDRTVRFNTWILKTKYEIPLNKIPFVSKIGEDLTLTPMYKYILDRNFVKEIDPLTDKAIRPIDRLDPSKIVPTDEESKEYLRFNRNSREYVELIRLDYVFTPRMNILAGFQYRKFINRDKEYREKFLELYAPDTEQPIEYRPSSRTRTFELQAINRGEWLGFNIVVLAGYRRRTDVLAHTTSNTTFVRAMMGF